jgi:hypothetical protein
MGRGWLPEPQEPLCRSRLTEHEAYRFFWDSSFDGHAVVHIGRKGELVTLRRQAFWQAPCSVALSLPDWSKLQQALEIAEFWSPRPDSELAVGLDGADWLIEGRRGDTYHAIHRWSPEGAIHDLGRVFFELAGPPLSGVRLY